MWRAGRLPLKNLERQASIDYAPIGLKSLKPLGSAIVVLFVFISSFVRSLHSPFVSLCHSLLAICNPVSFRSYNYSYDLVLSETGYSRHRCLHCRTLHTILFFSNIIIKNRCRIIYSTIIFMLFANFAITKNLHLLYR